MHLFDGQSLRALLFSCALPWQAKLREEQRPAKGLASASPPPAGSPATALRRLSPRKQRRAARRADLRSSLPTGSWRASLLHVDLSSSEDEDDAAAGATHVTARDVPRPRSADSSSPGRSSEEEMAASPSGSGRTLPYSPGSPARRAASRASSPLNSMRPRHGLARTNRAVMHALLLASDGSGGAKQRALGAELERLGFSVATAAAQRPEDLMQAVGQLFGMVAVGDAVVLAYTGPTIAAGQDRQVAAPACMHFVATCVPPLEPPKTPPPPLPVSRSSQWRC